jgi:hypothetical protein
VRLGVGDVGANAILDVQKAGLLLQEADVGIIEAKRGEALAQGGGGQVLDRQPMFDRGATDAVDDFTLGPADGEAAAGREQVFAHALLQLVPEAERPSDEGDVGGVLVIGRADDAGVAVRAAAVVGRGELLQAEDAPAAAGQRRRRRRPHAAEAEDEDVVHTLMYSRDRTGAKRFTPLDGSCILLRPEHLAQAATVSLRRSLP